MGKFNNDIIKLIVDPKYLAKKLEYEKTFFKLNGDYCSFIDNEITTFSASQMEEFFKNDQLSLSWINHETDNNMTVWYSFYEIWSFDPNIRTYNKIVYHSDLSDLSTIPKNHFNLFKAIPVKDSIIVKPSIFSNNISFNLFKNANNNLKTNKDDFNDILVIESLHKKLKESRFTTLLDISPKKKTKFEKHENDLIFQLFG